MKGFGIGCFNIEFMNPVKPGSIDQDDKYKILENFESQLRDSLNKIENLSNLKIDGLTPCWSPSFSRDKAGLVPSSTTGIVSFDVYIPKKKHPAIIHEYNADSFNVIIHFEYYKPVWLIIPNLNTNDDLTTTSPSTSVVIVREYLEEKFKLVGINFYTIGPSPFHCEFFLKLSDKLGFEIKRSDSYDEIVISSPEDETSLILSRLSEQLDIYYNSIFIKLRVWDQQSEVDDNLTSLIKNIEKNDFSPFVYLKRVSLSKRLNIDVLSLTRVVDFVNREIEKEISKVIDDQVLVELQKYINDKIRSNLADVKIDENSYDRVLSSAKDLITRTFEFYKSLIVGVFLAVLGYSLANLSRHVSMEDNYEPIVESKCIPEHSQDNSKQIPLSTDQP